MRDNLVDRFRVVAGRKQSQSTVPPDSKQSAYRSASGLIRTAQYGLYYSKLKSFVCMISYKGEIAKITPFLCAMGWFLIDDIVAQNINYLNTLEPLGGTRPNGTRVICLKDCAMSLVCLFLYLIKASYFVLLAILVILPFSCTTMYYLHVCQPFLLSDLFRLMLVLYGIDYIRLMSRSLQANNTKVSWVSHKPI